MEIAEIFTIYIGLMDIKGARDSTRSFEYKHSVSTTRDDNWQRIKFVVNNFLHTYRFLIIMFLAGVFHLLFGVIISIALPTSP
jgi:hypothetical protein